MWFSIPPPSSLPRLLKSRLAISIPVDHYSSFCSFSPSRSPRISNIAHTRLIILEWIVIRRDSDNEPAKDGLSRCGQARRYGAINPPQNEFATVRSPALLRIIGLKYPANTFISSALFPFLTHGGAITAASGRNYSPNNPTRETNSFLWKLRTSRCLHRRVIKSLGRQVDNNSRWWWSDCPFSYRNSIVGRWFDERRYSDLLSACDRFLLYFVISFT